MYVCTYLRNEDQKIRRRRRLKKETNFETVIYFLRFNQNKNEARFTGVFTFVFAVLVGTADTI